VASRNETLRQMTVTPLGPSDESMNAVLNLACRLRQLEGALAGLGRRPTGWVQRRPQHYEYVAQVHAAVVIKIGSRIPAPVTRPASKGTHDKYQVTEIHSAISVQVASRTRLRTAIAVLEAIEVLRLIRAGVVGVQDAVAIRVDRARLQGMGIGRRRRAAAANVHGIHHARDMDVPVRGAGVWIAHVADAI